MPVHAKPAPRAKSQPKPEPVLVDKRDLAWLNKTLQPMRDVIRKGEFDVLGHLSFVNIQPRDPNAKAPLIDFRKSGPAIAQARTMNQLVIVSPWEGIPPHVEISEDFCESCLAVCDVCNGKGEKICEAQYCGGSGTQHLPNGPRECVSCKGTGEAPCSSCRGLGNKATGLAAGSYDSSKGLCPDCHGRKFQSKETIHDPREFACGEYGGMQALGPIIRFSVRPLPGANRAVTPYIFDVMTDVYGDGMCLMVDEKAHQAFLMGGIAKRASR